LNTSRVQAKPIHHSTIQHIDVKLFASANQKDGFTLFYLVCGRCIFSRKIVKIFFTSQIIQIVYICYREKSEINIIDVLIIL